MNLSDILPPNDADCERSVIGCLLSFPYRIRQVREILSDRCFYNDRNRYMFMAMAEIYDRGGTPDAIGIIEILKRDNRKMALVDVSAYYAYDTKDIINSSRYLGELKIRRQLIRNSMRIISDSANMTTDVSNTLESSKKTLDDIYSDVDGRIIHISDVVGEVRKRARENATGKIFSGTKVGFREIDNRGGLQPGNLIVIAAESSQGKTSLADAFTLNAVKYGRPMAFYSLEMTSVQLTTRLIAMQSGISSAIISNAPMDEESMRRFNEASSTVRGLPLFFDDRSTSSIEAICGSIRALKIKRGIFGAVIDYLQILPRNAGYGNEESALADATRTLKNLAKQENIFIILLSQLSRDSSLEPKLNRLRGSGQIEEAADMVMLLYRPERYGKGYTGKYKDIDPAGTAQITVAKNRNGDCYDFIVGFEAQTTCFYELDRYPKKTEVKLEHDCFDENIF